jgi:hypothetical protein
MDEKQFVTHAVKVLHSILPRKYEALQGKSLLYENIVNSSLEPIANAKVPSRGHSAFETDLCIFYKKTNSLLIPKVVLEFKRSITTHDIITYSYKAKRHKLIYPYLRYGLISYNLTKIPKRFFLHNENIDFYLTLKHHRARLGSVLKKLILSEIKISNILEKTIFEKNEYDFFRTNLEFKNFK